MRLYDTLRSRSHRLLNLLREYSIEVQLEKTLQATRDGLLSILDKEHFDILTRINQRNMEDLRQDIKKLQETINYWH